MIKEETIILNKDTHYLNNNNIALMNKEGVIIDDKVIVEPNVKIYNFVILRGDCVIKSGAEIYPFCDLTDTIVGSNSKVRSTFSEGATIGDNCTIGPFACLRKGTIIGDNCRVGDYVEIKNSILHNGVKSAHLTYIGDAEVGENTNVGCGTVFANYNGVIKQRTKVGKNAFIGCNANLVAPLDIGDGAFIAAGSTVTHDVPSDMFCIAREKQRLKERR